MSTREKRALREAWLTELQAVAIYRAEIAFLKKSQWTQKRRKSLQLCQKILEEELEHQSWIEALNPEDRQTPWLTPLHRSAGYLLGSFLATLPYWLSWRLHILAEVQAEGAYLNAEKKLSHPNHQEMLHRAATQERSHAVLFQEALNETR